MLITEFKPGDVITRVEPAKDHIQDSSYIGDKIEFIKLENEKLYYYHNNYKEREYELSLSRWGFWWMGWEYFTKEVIQSLLDEAVKDNMLGLIDRYENRLKMIES